jgi:hypothetical protein
MLKNLKGIKSTEFYAIGSKSFKTVYQKSRNLMNMSNSEKVRFSLCTVNLNILSRITASWLGYGSIFIKSLEPPPPQFSKAKPIYCSFLAQPIHNLQPMGWIIF